MFDTDQGCWALQVAVKQGVAGLSKVAKYPAATASNMWTQSRTDNEGCLRDQVSNISS